MAAGPIAVGWRTEPCCARGCLLGLLNTAEALSHARCWQARDMSGNVHLFPRVSQSPYNKFALKLCPQIGAPFTNINSRRQA